MSIADSSPYIIIQARMSSTRLPGKVLLPLCNRSVLEIMISRLPKYNHNIIVATTDDGSEEPIENLCKNADIRYFKGDTQDVLSRYYEAAIKFGAKSESTIVRLTSDCPLIDQDILESMLIEFNNNHYDYLSNTVDRSFPRGLDIEIFSFDALSSAYNNASTNFESEHVTTYIHTTHKKDFKIGKYTHSEDNSKYRITLDEEDDYIAIKEIYKLMNCQSDFNYARLLKVLHENPYVYEINAHVEQKKR